MKRLLLIAYVFPPEPSPGAARPGFIARYLPEFGWEATVLTRSASEPPFSTRVVSTSAARQGQVRALPAGRALSDGSALRSTLRVARDFVLFPDLTAPWIPAALRTGAALLREERFDAILGTALPASVHVVGGLLARMGGIPWIADYRDPWAGNAYVRKGAVRKALEEIAERKLLARASAITTVSQSIAAQLRAFHGRDRVDVIPNAYDPQEWSGLADITPARFELCYTGSMYDGKRSPDMLFEALRDLRSAGDPAGSTRVHFYGPNSSNVSPTASRFGLDSIVDVQGQVSRAVALHAQREAAALLIFLNMDPSTANEMGSKFLEYIGARRPIIAIGPRESALRPFIAKHGLGWFASSTCEAKQALRAAHQRFIARDTEMLIDEAAFPRARDLARRFAACLDAALE